MKVCACCGAASAASEPICSQCGEASWMAALPSQEPALQVVEVEHKADKPKRAGQGHKK